jgi:hypothetical protein
MLFCRLEAGTGLECQKSWYQTSPCVKCQIDGGKSRVSVAEGYGYPVGSCNGSVILVAVERMIGDEYRFRSRTVDCENSAKRE